MKERVFRDNGRAQDIKGLLEGSTSFCNTNYPEILNPEPEVKGTEIKSKASDKWAIDYESTSHTEGLEFRVSGLIKQWKFAETIRMGDVDTYPYLFQVHVRYPTPQASLMFDCCCFLCRWLSCGRCKCAGMTAIGN